MFQLAQTCTVIGFDVSVNPVTKSRQFFQQVGYVASHLSPLKKKNIDMHKITKSKLKVYIDMHKTVSVIKRLEKSTRTV